MVAAAATDHEVQELLSYDLDVVNGISNVVKEHKITDIIIGLHHQKGISDIFWQACRGCSYQLPYHHAYLQARTTT